MGVALSLKFSGWLFLPCLFLLLTHTQMTRWINGAIILILSFAQTELRYSFPSLGEEKVYGKGLFHMDTLSIQSSPFQRSYVCTGSLDLNGYKNIPCRLYLPLHKPRPKANQNWQVTGYLIQKEKLLYTFKPTLCTAADGFSTAELRFQAKQACTTFLKEQAFSPAVSSFLLSMLTGDIEDRTLNLEFNRLGLQHILGVSGFQFVLLAGVWGFILRRFFPYKVATSLLLTLLTLYFLFLGDSPPVFRAWMGISLFLIGNLLKRTISPLNALGAALFGELIYSPFVITNIGFQLSFLCTFAILAWYPLLRKPLSFIMKKRSFKNVLRLSTLDQHGYLFGSFIRESVAINLAVHLVSLGLILFLFGKLPLLSLVYNLFFPLGATLSFLLLLLGVGVSLIVPPLASCIHEINNGFTEGLLLLTTHPPAFLQFYLRAPFISFETLVLGLTLLCAGALLWKKA